MNSTLKDIGVLIMAKYPLIEIVSFEDSRVEREMLLLARSLGKKLRVWSCSRGMHMAAESKPVLFKSSLEDGLQSFISDPENCIYLFKDVHPFLRNDPFTVRLLRESAAYAVNSNKNLVMLVPELAVPKELEKDITVVDFPLPDYAELLNVLTDMAESLRHKKNMQICDDVSVLERMAKAAVGLSLTEAENVFAKAVVSDGILDEKDINFITKEKQQAIRKCGTLEYQEPDASLDSVGGLENLKEWALKRKNAFSEKARLFGLPEPKGMLLVGVQGCGKSLCAKALSSYWQLPLLRLDMGSLYGKYIGESEQNTRTAMKTAESLAPVILWIDEIEKGFAGLGNDGDSGTSSRVFGSFLTWMQEKRKPVFIFATSNDISKLPPEFLRKGRFDEIFFVDLPSAREREDIFSIHLQKRGKCPEDFDIRGLAAASQGFSGAEIEQAIVSGLYDAFDENREFVSADIARAIAATSPLSVTAREKIQWLRDWSVNRAVRASREV